MFINIKALIPRRYKNVILLACSTIFIYGIYEYYNRIKIPCNVSRPGVSDLQFDNIYWQTLHTTIGPFKLFSAFYDDRDVSSIRIIAMINRTEIQNVTTYCQFWFNETEKSMISKIIKYELIWHHGWDNNIIPFLITCPYDFNKYQIVPEGVSLVNNNCNQSGNYLNILNNRPVRNVVKKPFVVCLTDFNFDNEEMAIRLVEWIELLRLLGADKIFIYQFHAIDNVLKVFDYYERYGTLEIVKISYPQNVPVDRGINEVISINDCFYRNIYLYDYVAIFDLDEVIIPKIPDDMSWLDMLDRIKHNQTKNESYASYNFRNIYFLDNLQHSYDWHPDIPDYLHILQHINRAINYTVPGYSMKSFHNTELVKIVHNNYPVSCLYNGGSCDNLDVNTEFGHLAHYRRVCPQPYLPEGTCKYYVHHKIQDKTVWKYKTELIKQSMKVINILELIGKDTNYIRINRKRHK